MFHSYNTYNNAPSNSMMLIKFQVSGTLNGDYALCSIALKANNVYKNAPSNSMLHNWIGDYALCSIALKAI